MGRMSTLYRIGRNDSALHGSMWSARPLAIV